MFVLALRRSPTSLSTRATWLGRGPSLITLRQYVSNSSSSVPLRAFIFSEPGDPLQVVKARTFHPLPPPAPDEVQLRIRLATINPSDVNVLQGVYPSKPRPRTDLGTPQPIFIPGNEGLGEVVAVGSAVSSESRSPGIKVGDRVVMGTPQAGTWSNIMNIKSDCVISVDKGVTDSQAATMSVCTLWKPLNSEPPSEWGSG